METRTPISTDENKQVLSAPPQQMMINVDRNWGVCPITHCYIQHPVVGKDGYRYEAQALLENCKKLGNKSPITRGPVLPIIYDLQNKQDLDSNANQISDRYENYDHKPIVKELNSLIPKQNVVTKQRVTQQSQPACDSPWIKSGLKAVGTAFTFSMGVYLAYSQLHSGLHNETNEHRQEDMQQAMVAPVFYIALLLDLGIRKFSRHQFGIFSVVKNTIEAACNAETHLNNEPRERNGFHAV